MEWYVKTNTYWEIKKKLLAPAGYNLDARGLRRGQVPEGLGDDGDDGDDDRLRPGSGIRCLGILISVAFRVQRDPAGDDLGVCCGAQDLMWWGRWVPGCPFNVVEPPERFLAFTHVGVV